LYLIITPYRAARELVGTSKGGEATGDRFSLTVLISFKLVHCRVDRLERGMSSPTLHRDKYSRRTEYEESTTIDAYMHVVVYEVTELLVNYTVSGVGETRQQ